MPASLLAAFGGHEGKKRLGGQVWLLAAIIRPIKSSFARRAHGERVVRVTMETRAVVRPYNCCGLDGLP